MFSNLRKIASAFLRVSKSTGSASRQGRRALETLDTKDVLSPREIAVYKKLFDKMDSNQDGFLTRDDLDRGLKELAKYAASEAELAETMETLDADRDGAVGFDEFVGHIAWSRQMRAEDAIRGAFDAFDRDKDGLINRDEVREAMVSLGLIPNEPLLDNIMSASDRDGDGHGNIDLDAFRRVFYKQDLAD